VNKFNVISKKFYNQFRNGDNFNLNLTEFTDRLQGNVGERVKLVEEIEIATIVNEDEAIDIEFIQNASGSFALLRSNLLDFVQEGLYNGATLRIEFNGTNATATCEGVTNTGNIDLKIDSTGRTNLLAAGLTDGEIRDDIVIKVTNAPTYLTYKYGLIDNEANTNNYANPLDGAEQAYYRDSIGGLAVSMFWLGREIGSNFGEASIQFNSTADLYKHKFTVTHEFIIPYYTENEFNNITQVKNPDYLRGTKSIKYCNGFFFGGSTSVTVAQFEDNGSIGNVGYFNENFNGLPNNYTTEDFTVTNSLRTGKIEATVTNTVTFSISDTSGFSGGEEIILYHTKLPSSLEYSRQTDSFGDVWLNDQVRITEGAAPVGSTIISNGTSTINAFGGLDISFDLQFAPNQVEQITEGDNYAIYYTVATRNPSDPNTNDRTNVLGDVTDYTKDPSQSGLITNWQPYIFNHWNFDAGTKKFTDFLGWDGDLMGMDWTFDLDISDGSTVASMKLKVVVDNGTDTNYTLREYTIPIGAPQTTTVGGNQYQLLNIDVSNQFNQPNTEELNRIIVEADDSFTGTTQTFTGSIGFRIPWQDWIKNSLIPSFLTDFQQPSDGRHRKTSYYDDNSVLFGFDVKVMLEVTVQGQPVQSGNTQITAITTYELLSDSCNILDFDDAGGTGFTGSVKIYDVNGDITDTLSSNQKNRIEIEFDHSLGVIAKNDIWGRIWIEPENSFSQPSELSTDKDWTPNFSGVLVPSDTLLTGNVDYVEVVSVSDKVTLICETNPLQIVNGINYNIYGRIGSKV
jgi:hypothetical protein